MFCLKSNLKVELLNVNGQIVMNSDFYQGTTICHLETSTLYDGIYFVRISGGDVQKSFKVVLKR